MKKESHIQAAILNYLRSLGWWCWAVKAAVCNERGVPDILCSYKGRFAAFEVKTEKGRLSGPQRVQILRIRKTGAKAAIVRSVQDVQEVLKTIDSELNDTDGEQLIIDN